jgi:NADPH2:quinone reductase
VAWATSLGSYAELAVVSAEQAVPVPQGVDSETAAGSLLQGMTAHYLTVSVHPVQPGHTVLVHAAAGGLGQLLTQLAIARGARVIGTVSTPEKERLAREAGAADVIRYSEIDDVAGEVRRLTGGDGVAAVYDGVGASTFDASLASLRPRGMLALYGAASGPVSPVDPQRLNSAGSVFLTRPKLADYVATRDELAWRAGEVFDAIQDGSLRISIGGRYPLAEAGRAHQDRQAPAAAPLTSENFSITVRSGLTRLGDGTRRKAQPSINHSNASPSRNSSTDASGTTSIHPCVARLTIA